MKVLHICNDFFGSPVYPRIFSSLHEKCVDQWIYVFLRQDQIELLDENMLALLDQHKVVLLKLSRFYSFFGRFLPSLRNRHLLARVHKEVESESFDLIHAHTIFSNGSFARLLNKVFSIPFVVSARNVDVNSAYKYFVHLRVAYVRTMLLSKKIIFLNPAHKRLTLGRLSNKNQKSQVNQRSLVIPNPINQKWFRHLGVPKKLNDHGLIKVLYVGELSSNKNIDFLLDVFEGNWYNGRRFEVDIVGHIKPDKQGIAYSEKCIERMSLLDNVTYHGEQRGFERLRDYYRNADIFFMASTYETFGLVYIESISQGTPIIYTTGQGVDGYFEPGEVGYPIVPGDVEGAKKEIRKLIEKYPWLSMNCLKFASRFETNAVVDELLDVYNNVLSE